MKSSRVENHSRFSSIPLIRFENQQLSSFSGIVIFQALFQRLNLKSKFRSCFSHLKIVPIFGLHTICLLLVVHLLTGFRRLRDRDYYQDDPLIKRILGLKNIPDVSTLSRALKNMDPKSVKNIRELSQNIVFDRIHQENLPRMTLDFDGSVLSTTRHAQGTAVGFNKKKKGARSYYPLFCTIAQTGQFFDVHHRPGNVHDSNGAKIFMKNCFDKVKQKFPQTVIESRMDSAFFSDEIIFMLNDCNIELSASVPFERFVELKSMIESRKKWKKLDDTWSCFETTWKPKSWTSSFRFIFIRQQVTKQTKGVLQLDLFIPKDHKYEYKVIVTNKRSHAQKVLKFHNGRGSQEGLFAEAKTHCQMDYIPTKNLCGNQVYMLSAVMAHNLNRELQMQTQTRTRGTTEKRAPHWTFESLGSIRHKIIQKAGKLTRPCGQLTLTMNTNHRIQERLLNLLHLNKKAA